MIVHHVVGFQAGDGFDAAHAGGDGGLGHDAEQTDLAGRARVRAAAQFHRVTVELVRRAADLDDADGVAVFVAEELHHVLAVLHVGVRDFGPRDAGVFEDAFVDELLDVGDLRGRERGAVEVEGQLVRADEGTFLRGFLAHDFVQRPVEQMRDGVVALDGIATRLLDGERDVQRRSPEHRRPRRSAGRCCRTSGC